MKKIIATVMASALLVSCTDKPKTLVLYYSQTGATESVANELKKQIKARDIVRFDVTDPYSGTFQETIERCMQEKSAGLLPELAALDVDLSKYDVIFLGYPVWFGVAAVPVESLIEAAGEQLAGKKIVPFCTFGSGGLESSVAELKAKLPESEIADGYGVRNARVSKAPAELKRFLIENGYRKGTVEELPPYGEPQSVTEELAAIYNEAVDGYPYPMGMPIRVEMRNADGGEDYVFTTASTDRDGNVAEGKVYVSRRDGKSEFTQVAR